MNALFPSDAAIAETSSEAVRERLRAGEEIALLDVREEEFLQTDTRFLPSIFRWVVSRNW